MNLLLTFEAKLNMYYNMDLVREKVEEAGMQEELRQLTTNFILENIRYAELVDKRNHVYKLIFEEQTGISNIIIEPSSLSIYQEGQNNESTFKMISLCYSSQISMFLNKKFKEINDREIIDSSDNVVRLFSNE
jgi:hypothetical protein